MHKPGAQPASQCWVGKSSTFLIFPFFFLIFVLTREGPGYATKCSVPEVKLSSVIGGGGGGVHIHSFIKCVQNASQYMFFNVLSTYWLQEKICRADVQCNCTSISSRGPNTLNAGWIPVHLKHRKCKHCVEWDLNPTFATLILLKHLFHFKNWTLNPVA